jgi:hypothetical protein
MTAVKYYLMLDGIPKFYYYGVEGDFYCLVMELVGPSLEVLLGFCGNRFSLRSVLIIGNQMVTLYF